MGRCQKCGKKVCKSSSRVCKSQNKNRENNANNAQIINVDVIPDTSQVLTPSNDNAQNNQANSGQINPIQSQIGSNGGSFSPVQPIPGAAAAASPLGGLTAEEVKNLLKGATDFATEASGQGSFPADAAGAAGRAGCGCGCANNGKKNKKKNGKQCGCGCHRGGDSSSSSSSKQSYRKKQNQKAKNNKVNVNLAVILTRANQTPTQASAQSADNANLQAPITIGGPVTLPPVGSAADFDLQDEE